MGVSRSSWVGAAELVKWQARRDLMTVHRTVMPGAPLSSGGGDPIGVVGGDEIVAGCEVYDRVLPALVLRAERA